jgi:hypothetical protein
VPGLFRAAIAVGVRALARGADARWRAVVAAAAGVLSGVWRDACAVPGVVGAASARRGGGDRRRTRAGCRRPRASADRSAARASAGTVRGWLRAARARSESLRACANRWVYALDPEMGPVTPAGSALGDAVEALMLAVRARVLRFGHGQLGPWERAVWLTDGLLSGRPPLPP